MMPFLRGALLCPLCSILAYGSLDTGAQCLLTSQTPGAHPVLCLKHNADYLFAGLQNGTVAVYARIHGE